MATHKGSVRHESSTLFVSLVAGIAAIGGLLFGYDQGVISGAVGFLQTQFQMNEGLLGFVSACIPLGAMAGVIIAGITSDKFGRKPILLAAGLLFVISSLGCAFTQTVAILILARIIGGLGVGVASLLVPLYISEISPARIRGRLVGTNQLGIASGIFVVYIVNAIIANTHTQNWDQTIGWRWMFGVGAIPGILFFILLFWVPESPRYLLKKGEQTEAKAVLERINGPFVAKAEMTAINAALRDESKSPGFVGELVKKGFKIAMLVAVVLAAMQQFTGTSAVAYYAPIIFKQSGAGANAALIETIMIGAIKVIFTIVLMLLVDRVGRKRLLMIGAAGMAICLIIVGGVFEATHIIGWLVLAMVLLHTVAFELSWGGGVWIVISEIFPTRIRGRAMAMASFVLWGATYLVTQFFPVLLKHAGSSMTFWIFALMCIIMFLFTWRMVPETKGKTLEDIQAEWDSMNLVKEQNFIG
ncbi:sugar porter family MFS transporter [Pullulanibacillus sp. KACC 23026]|uniref:sugar porter family MFS transporter n=1 Tax=Pullulanibacillus sp. KACC 23026 TaxID=3028315 RepID=UPI0023B0A2CF|nr:sugar porter family MFS transporter [Pullulanibacillus sp. KACC 23026]WEG10755.1 sugar porter family MFS transporter [Pullulanibacillus sp. KACC 23026]